ncbi:MAG: ABC transporter permease [Bacteroidetes bacterium]|nr:ABC transporter permease [Bacteroidota bacterium]
MILKFAWRYFRAKKSANAINIIAWVTTAVIAFATCCQILVLSVFNGFEDLVKSLYTTFYSDIKISPASGKTFFLSGQKINELKNLSYISKISAIAEEKALLRNGENQTVIYLKGVDSNYNFISHLSEKITRGTYETGDTDKPLMIMGSGIQNATGISLNPLFNTDPIIVILPKNNVQSSDPLESLSEGLIQPAGVFSVQQDFDNQFAITNIGFVKQQLGFKDDEYSSLSISLKNGIKPESVKADLQKILGNRYLVQTKYEQNANLYSTMQLEKWAIFAVLTLILIVAAFNMISSLTMLVLEKKRDISILSAMGASQNLIRKIFLSEGILLGVIGGGIGICLAAIICILQLNFHLIPMQGGSFLIDYFPVKMLWTDFVLVAITAISISILAAIFPAYSASKNN